MILATAIGILVATTLLFVLLIKWRQQYWKRKGIPQLKPSLIYGDTMDMITGVKSLQEYYRDLYTSCKVAGLKHVGIYKACWGIEYVPLDLNQIKFILTKDHSHFEGHGTYHDKNDPFSMNLFTIEGQEWKERRSKLTPMFSSGKMKMMFETVVGKTDGIKPIIDKHIDANEPVNIKEIMARFTTDVIASVAFGLECNTLAEPNHTFRQIGKKAMKPVLVKFILELLLPYNFLAKLGYRTRAADVESYFTKVVKDTLNYREKNNVVKKDFIQLMMQLKNQGAISAEDGLIQTEKGKNSVTEQDVINEAFLLYLAGFETSSSAMTFTLFEVSQNLEIQEKLRKEILETLEKHNGKITYESIMEMEYLDKVLKESLRIYPVVSVLPRVCTKSYKLLDSNITIEKGTLLTIPIIGMHMDEEYFPNPKQFNPENFNPENKEKRPDSCYLPFGEGPRQCIGMRFGLMQAKIGIVVALKDFRFTLHESMQPPYKPDSGSLVYVLKKDVMLRATRL